MLQRVNNGRLSQVVDGLEALLIDEFQDTNYLQEQIYLELCRHSGASLTVVGDDDQSIYRFRGATVEIFANFQSRVTEALGVDWTPRRVDLFRNYRSTERVVNFCQHFITMDTGFLPARAPGKIALVAQAERATIPARNLPILGMFRTDVQTLAADLTQLLWDIFRGQGRQIVCGDTSFEIISSPGGDFGDSVLLGHSVREKTGGNNPRDRLPLLLRQSLRARGIDTFNPRGQALSDIPNVQRLLGLALACIDPNAAVLNTISASSMSRSVRTKMADWLAAAQAFLATNPAPGGLPQFVQGWRTRTRQTGTDGNWPREWPLLDLMFTLTTWFTEFQDSPEGQVYLEAITRTISEVGQMSSYNGQILHNNPPHDTNSILQAIRAVFEAFAAESVDVDEEIMPYVPRNYFPIMTVHQAKGLEFPLVVVDVGSDFRTNHHTQRRARCPDQGDSVHSVESDVAQFCTIGMLRTSRSNLDRAWDDIRRLYFVAYSRSEDLLLLAGLTSQIRTNPVPCISAGNLSDGGRGLTFVSANQWTKAAGPGTVALI